MCVRVCVLVRVSECARVNKYIVYNIPQEPSSTGCQ